MPVPIGVYLLAPPLAYIYAYQRKARKLYAQLTASDIEVTRVYEIPEDPPIKFLELEPEFIKKHWETRKMMSFGQYFSTLRFKSKSGEKDVKVQQFLEQEITASLVKAMMGAMGSTAGGAALPMLLNSGSPANMFIAGTAGKFAKWLSMKMVHENRLAADGVGIHATPDDQEEDAAMFPLSISELINVIQINQENFGAGKLEVSPLDMLIHGEVPAGNSFETLISSPFDMESGFHATIEKMEDLIRETNPDYDPDAKGAGESVPVNPDLFPDLYSGPGDAEMTHTEREALENRLMGILLNKLTYNYYKLAHDDTDTFVVTYNGATCTHPEELVEQLLKTGHTIDCAPKCQVTSFGVKFCVKDEDGSFINVPVAVQLRTGYERYNDSRPVCFAAPHGGLDLYIRGPLIGSTNSCALQFYVAFTGLCAFHADHDVANMPWIQKSTLAEPYNAANTVRAVRMAGLISVATSIIATEMNLPFGGYGVLGVCNDLGAIIDFSVNDKTNAYPLTAAGRFIGHFIRCLTELQKKMEAAGGLDLAVHDIQKIIHGFATIGNDLQATPSQAWSVKDRFKLVHDEFYFTENARSYEVMKDIAENYKVLSEWHGDNYGAEEQKVGVSSTPSKKWGRKK